MFIFREAYHPFKNIAMPWSMGKDSNVLIWLRAKSFFGRVPFPVLHIDTTYEFPEMLEFREWATTHYKLESHREDQRGGARHAAIGYETHDPVTVTHELKTVALAAGDGGTQMGRAHHRHPARRRSDAREGALFFAAQRAIRVGLQGSAAGILGAIRHHRREQANTCACSRCSIGPRSISGATSSAKIFRFRRCISREMANAIARSAAGQSPNRSRATQLRSRRSSLNSKPRRTSERAGRAQDHHERNAMQKLRAKGFHVVANAAGAQIRKMSKRQSSTVHGIPASSIQHPWRGDPACRFRWSRRPWQVDADRSHPASTPIRCRKAN